MPEPGFWSETKAERDQRMAWWREARFGMFVHWGLYSQLGRHEWVMNRERIPVAEYEKLADTWQVEAASGARVGRAGETGRHEVHGDDHQAPRGLLPVGYAADRLQRRQARPGPRPGARIRRSLPRVWPEEWVSTTR